MNLPKLKIRGFRRIEKLPTLEVHRTATKDFNTVYLKIKDDSDGGIVANHVYLLESIDFVIGFTHELKPALNFYQNVKNVNLEEILRK